MLKKIKWIVLMCIFVLTLEGCGNKKIADTETNKIKTSEEDVDEPNKEDDTEQENSGTSDDTTEQENESIDNASDTGNNSNTTTKPSNDSNNNTTTTKPSTGNTDSNKKPSTGSTTKPSTGSTNNSGNTGNTSSNNTGTTTQPSTPVHEHKWVEVTEEEIHYYAWRTICGKCKADLTDMTDDELTWHTVAECHSGYSTHYIEVDFVTENVVKTPVVTGYKCECGAEKK